MKYELKLRRRPSSYLRRASPETRQRIGQRLNELLESPYSPAISKILAGREGLRSSRIGNLRILYFVEDAVHIVDVVEIGPRGDIYGGGL